MTSTYIKDIKNYKDQAVTLKGWIYNLRSSGKIMFLEMRDGTGFVQGIVDQAKVGEPQWRDSQKITIESSVEMMGTVTEHPKKPGVFELHVTDIKVLSLAPEYPIGKKEHGPDFLLDHRHLWLRSRSQWAILRLRHWVKTGLQEYYNQNGFIELDTPTFTPNACEGTTDLFEVEYFDRKAYLTQNGQLYLEAMCMAFGRVYDLCPNFRAEKSKTRKHLTEFWSLNPEIAFIGQEESLQIQEASLKYLIKFVLEYAQEELVILERATDVLKEFIILPFIHYEYKDAIATLQKRGSAIEYGDDFGAEDEELLTRDTASAVVIKNWPKILKPFYVKAHPTDDSLVLNADILAPCGFGEIIGGSQREDDFETLLSNIKAHRLPIEVFEWYLDLRKYGSVPHCGFGMGIERITRWIAGIHHIRETVPFPRMLNRITP